jgi:hypothetical protein
MLSTLAADVFPASYAASRRQFQALAATRGLAVASRIHPLTGPSGETLATDIVRLGPPSAARVLIVSSATHGIEGFCGAGIQAALLRPETLPALPPDTSLVLVHAVNPYGYAHLRRTDEANIDLNRNFRDHTELPPGNAAYDEIHDWLVPADWDGPARAGAEAALARYVEQRGARALQAAACGGQYGHADGLFYGGCVASWSNHTWRALLREFAGDARAVAIIDVHTGLGARGACELISGAHGDPAEQRRARRWFGEELVFPGVSSTAPASMGYMGAATADILPRADAALVVAEFGTEPFAEILECLRADNWIHARSQPGTPLWAEIKARMQRAFVGTDAAWREAVLERGLALCRHTLSSLAEESP